MHPYFSYDASHAHRRGHGDKEKKSHFLLVAMRPTAHSRRYVCIRNCVDGFSMDTGQSLVTTKECEITCVITKRRIMLIFECTYKGEFLVGDRTHQFCYQKECTRIHIGL